MCTELAAVQSRSAGAHASLGLADAAVLLFGPVPLSELLGDEIGNAVSDRRTVRIVGRTRLRVQEGGVESHQGTI